LTLGRRGTRVACVDRLPCDATVAAVREQGGQAAGFEADLVEEQQVQALFPRLEASLGRVDILVNNAGFFEVERRPFWEIDLPEWEKVMTINVRSVYLCCREVAASMRGAGSGRIINVASSVVTFGMPNLMHYVAAKAAVIGISRSMARELGPFGVTVNAVAPGLVATETALRCIGEEVMQQTRRGQAVQQQLLPGDVAHVVAFLAGDEARLLTGQTLLINGGATCSGA